MNYQVLWSENAADSIVRIGLATRFLSRWVEALKRLEARLARDPLTCGESREGTTRIAFERPVGCVFNVDVAGRTVVVGEVWSNPAI